METAAGIAILVAIIGIWIAYGRWLTNGIKPRQFETSVSKDQLRALFMDKVAGHGWKIIDDGNPMVAQSSLITGIRQQIGLDLRTAGATTVVVVGPQRWVTKYGIPKKAHTIRFRLNSFVSAVQATDPAARPQLQDLRGR